jgi:FeS assembly SUF system regulator
MIRITRLADYAIVVLSHFASDRTSPVRTARLLAEETRIPLPTVSKILKALARKGLVASQRGVHGGYRLTRDLGSISVAEAIDALEGPIAMTECQSGPGGLCVLEPTCPARSNWERINRAVRKALDEIPLTQMSPIPSPRRPAPARAARA